jgi:putative ABC transport system substrate-binding protein
MTRHSRRRFLRGGLALAGFGLLSGCDLAATRQRTAGSSAARLGILTSGLTGGADLAPLREALHGLGYDLAKLEIDHRTTLRTREFPDLAAQLARREPDVIVAGTTPAVLAATQAAPTVPVVMVECGDPLGAGLIASLARPGGNVTGLSSVSPPLSAKRLQLLREAAPALSRLAVVRNPENADAAPDYAATEAAAHALSLGLVPIEVRSDGEVDAALERMRSAQAEGIVTFHDPVIFGNRARIIGFARTHRLPTMFDRRPGVVQGGLLSYGPNPADGWRRAAGYVDKILKGARPADLPVEQPTTFEFTINLTSARALGLTIPQSVLAQADELIQ